MSRLFALSLFATASAGGVLSVLLANPPVELQPTTPGIAQDGNLNITGRVLGGSLHASSSSSSAQVIFGTATSTTGNTFAGAFRSDSIAGVGVYGWATAATGTTNGVRGQSFSSSGTGVFGWVTATSGFNYGVRGESASTSGTGVSGLATATTGFTNGLRGQSDSTTGKGVFGVASATSGINYGVYGRAASPNGYGVYSDGNMGTNGILSAGVAQFGGTNANQVLFVQNAASANDAAAIKALASGANGTTTGGYFVSLSPNGQGVYGYAPATGVYGEGSDGVRGVGGSRGVFGSVSGNSGVTYGVWGQTDSTSGIGTFGYATASTGQNFGVYGHSLSTTGIGVYGEATTSTGLNLGVWGRSMSTQGTGVWGETTATSGSNQGVYGINRSPDGFGVYGHNTTTGVGVLGSSNGDLGTGVKGTSVGTAGRGVSGISTGSAGDGVNGYAMTAGGSGVYGKSETGSGFGVYSSGNMAATGGKSFLIDHPSDPENKYLVHYSTESPSPQNFYVGNVTTDGAGYAWVELPSYFADINKNFKYQLTVVDDADEKGFVQVKVSKKIQGNRFQIRSSSPKTEVSWRVDADRNDLWMRQYPAKDVVEKVGRAKGKYVRPELYNLGPEFGDHYDSTIDKPQSVPPVAEASARRNRK